MFNLVPVYAFSSGKHSIGFSLIGYTSSYTQDDNNLVMRCYMIVNPL